MDRLIDHDEIRELLGAYALDAVDSDEAASIDAHVRRCPRCAAELDEFRATAAALANHGGDAPGVLWDRISAELQVPRGASGGAPAPRLLAVGTEWRGDVGGDRGAGLPGGNAGLPGGGSGGGAGRFSDAGGVPGVAGAGSAVARSRRWWRTSATAAIAAAAAVAIALLAVQVGRLDGRVGSLSALASHQSMPALAEQALADPQAQRVALLDASAPGRTVADLVILPSGTAYLVESTLPALPANETYQLWGMVSGQAVSLGLLGNHPGVEALVLDADAPPREFAVTAEPAGGVVISNHAPVAEGTIHSS